MFELGNLMAPPEVATARAEANSFGSQLFQALFPKAQSETRTARIAAHTPRPQLNRVRESLTA